jgi:hypothetical protein
MSSSVLKNAKKSKELSTKLQWKKINTQVEDIGGRWSGSYILKCALPSFG